MNINRAALGQTIDRSIVESSLDQQQGKSNVPSTLIEVEGDDELNGTKEAGGTEAQEEEKPTKLALVSTIQFVAAVQTLREELAKTLPPLEPDETEEETQGSGAGAIVPRKSRMVGLVDQSKLWRGRYEIIVPQTKPLSPGEILGCTAPKLTEDVDALM